MTRARKGRRAAAEPENEEEEAEEKQRRKQNLSHRGEKKIFCFLLICRILAQVWDSRPIQVAIYTVLDEESESEVEKCKILEPGGKN